MHTHFGSATMFAATILNVLLGLTLWRLIWAHALTSKSATVRGLARAAFFQSG